MIETLYIARHGFRLNWVTSNWSSPTGLPRDPPLTAFGVGQADELASYFASLPEENRPTAIFSSPYYRCLQTAEPTAKALNIPVFVEHGIAEWYSPVTPGTGLHPRPSGASLLQQYFPCIDPSWTPTWMPPRTGEDVEEVHQRCADFLQAFADRLHNSNISHKRVLLISHAATIIALVRALIGIPRLPLRVGCCSLTILDSESVTDSILGHWRLVSNTLASGSHLKDGALRDWGFEDIEIADGRVVTDRGEPGSEHVKDENVGLQRHSTLLPSSTISIRGDSDLPSRM